MLLRLSRERKLTKKRRCMMVERKKKHQLKRLQPKKQLQKSQLPQPLLPQHLKMLAMNSKIWTFWNSKKEDSKLLLSQD